MIHCCVLSLDGPKDRLTVGSRRSAADDCRFEFHGRLLARVRPHRRYRRRRRRRPLLVSAAAATTAVAYDLRAVAFCAFFVWPAARIGKRFFAFAVKCRGGGGRLIINQRADRRHSCTAHCVFGRQKPTDGRQI